MKVNEVISALHPLLNEKWITPLLNTQGFLSVINNAVQFINSYKWRIRPFQLASVEQDTSSNHKLDIISIDTFPNIVDSIHWIIFSNNWKEYKKQISLVYNDNFLKLTDVSNTSNKVPVYFLENTIKILLTDENVTSVKVIYFKWLKKLLTVDDEIDLPYLFFPAVVSFSAAYILPIYSQDQGITNWHFQQGINVMESIRNKYTNTSWTINFKW